jgi:P27 family predicted phage terminase small subunit
MAMGPKPKPAQLVRLHGNPSRSPRRVEVDGVGDLWSPPSWMDAEQRAQWVYGVEHAPRGLLTLTDIEAYTSWVCASVEFRRAVVAVQTEGQVVYTPDGRPLQNPRMRTMTEQAGLAMKASDRLGFSPVARASLGKAYAAGGPGQLLGSKLQAYLDDDPDKLPN